MKCIVSIAPYTSLFAVYIDMRIAHCTIKLNGNLSVCRKVRNIERVSVPPHTYKRQTTCAASMLHGFFLSILCNGYILAVVGRTERTIYCPIVRYTNCFPITVVEIFIARCNIIFSGKLPPLLQGHLQSSLPIGYATKSNKGN